MRKIKVGKKEIKIMGSAITSFFYKQAFDASLSGDLMKLNECEKDLSKLDDVVILQMIWAMAKTVNREITPFVNWLEEIEYIDLNEILNEVTEEASNACFRSSQEKTDQNNN